MTREESNIIRSLRLPLMIMVVFIHSFLIDRDGMIETIWIEHFFSQCLPAVAVPLFMTISGFLFFTKCKNGNYSFFSHQLKKRVKTLVIPYVLWNAIVIIFFFCLHRFVPSLINSEFENVSSFSFPQLLNCFWRGSGGFPIAYQFWFIRDLIIISLFTPFIYYFAKRGTWTLIVYLIFYYSFSISYLEISFYYFVGAFCSLNRIDFVKFSRKFQTYAIPIALMMLSAMAFGYGSEFVRKTYILSGGITILSLQFLYNTNKITSILYKYSESSFFLFSVHGIIALLLCKLLTKIIRYDYQLIWIPMYFLNIISIILICIGLYNLMKKYTPKILSILTGNR